MSDGVETNASATSEPTLGGEEMHIHKPKATHGVREFLSEIGVIVVGVLIALAAEQLVELATWREQSRLTEEALNQELVLAATQSVERIAVAQCLSDRIEHLTGKLRQQDLAWRADPMLVNAQLAEAVKLATPAAYRAPSREWYTGAWETAKASGVLNHMPRNTVAGYTKIYAEIEIERQTETFEFQTAPELAYLSFDTELDPQARRQAVSTLGKLDSANGNLVQGGRQILDRIKAMHLNFDRRGVATQVREALAVQRAFRGSCVRDVVADI